MLRLMKVWKSLLNPGKTLPWMSLTSRSGSWGSAVVCAGMGSVVGSAPYLIMCLLLISFLFCDKMRAVLLARPHRQADSAIGSAGQPWDQPAAHSAATAPPRPPAGAVVTPALSPGVLAH